MAVEELNFSALPEKARLARVAEQTAKGAVINFGYVHPEQRTDAQERTHAAIMAGLPRFGIRGRFQLTARRYALWQHARKLLGRDPHWVWQQTGSCVGAAWGNMLMVAMAVEILLKGEREDWKWPWWLFTYGRGRLAGGMRGRGEGSFGSAQAKAATTDGAFELDPAGEPDLPDPTIRNGHAVCPGSLEMEWSDGGRIAANWLKVGKTHPFKTAAPIRSTSEAIDALANGYPLTCASMFGFSPMVPPVAGSGADAVRLVKSWNGSWAHQMWVDEFWDHPTLGPIFGWGQNWGPGAHGQPAGDYPDCKFYTTEAVFAKVLASRDAECFAFSGFDGFPAREEQLNFSPL